MDTTSIFTGKYMIDVSEDNSVVPDNPPQRNDVIYVSIWFTKILEYYDHDNFDVLNEFTTSLFISFDDFSAKENMGGMLSAHISYAKLPLNVEEEIINKVFNVGSLMLRDPDNVGRKMLPIVVDITVRVFEDELDEMTSDDEEIGWAMEEDMNEEFRPCPATKSSIQTLEKIIIDESCSVTQCTICFEKFTGELEVTRIPCSHIYHGGCIERWLEKSNLCPLCRFAMPCVTPD